MELSEAEEQCDCSLFDCIWDWRWNQFCISWNAINITSEGIKEIVNLKRADIVNCSVVHNCSKAILHNCQKVPQNSTSEGTNCQTKLKIKL